MPTKSFSKRLIDVVTIYNAYKNSGLSNRDIWKRYIYPVYGISERTYYNYLKKSAEFGV